MPGVKRLNWDRTLIGPGQRVLVGLSGGADSLCLLHLLARAREEHGFEVEALHVHHGMRGESADADVRFLQDRCEAWGVPFTLEVQDVPGTAEACKISVEEAGREVRYRSFFNTAVDRDCDLIATAHTADDQAETVLMRLFRGSGLDGMAGIPRRRPARRGHSRPEIIRPLLDVWRRDIEAYCREHDLEPRLDVTNLDRRYRRSRIRLELIPLLESYDPHLKRHLVRLAAQAASEKELLLPEAERLLVCLVAHSGEDLRVVDAAKLIDAPSALTRRALRLHLHALEIEDAEGEAEVVERLMALARGGRGGFTLPGGNWRVRRVDGTLVFERSRIEPAAAPVRLPPAGTLDPPGWGFTFTLETVDPPAQPRRPPNCVYLDQDRLRAPFLLRAPENGDRFRPLGAPGSKLLSDLFSERKVLRRRRANWPVVCDQEGIVWVVGLAVAERCRVAPGTVRCLLMEVDPLPKRS